MSTETCEARVLIIFDWGYSDLSSIQPRNSERLGPTTDPWTPYWQHYFDKFSCPCSNFIWALQAWKAHELVIFCIKVICFKPRFSWGTASGSAQWLSFKLLVGYNISTTLFSPYSHIFWAFIILALWNTYWKYPTSPWAEFKALGQILGSATLLLESKPT